MDVKKTIAIDIDDVLAASIEALRIEVNKRLGTDLKPEDYFRPSDYWGYFNTLWQSHGLGDQITLADLEQQMIEDQSHIYPHAEAMLVLKELSKHYKLAVVTARDTVMKVTTERWLHANFENLFDSISFAGHRDDPAKKTKGEMCLELGATWLIDDNVEHCESARALGIQALLFGSYGWQHKAGKELIRLRDWPAVSMYFKQVEAEAQMAEHND